MQKSFLSRAGTCLGSVLALSIIVIAAADRQAVAEAGPVLGQERLAAGLFFPSVRTLATRELKSRFQDVLFVDVRSRFEFDVVHITGSVSVPWTGNDDEFARLAGASQDKTLVLVGGDSGDTRPFRIALSPLFQGAARPRVYEAGVLAWIDACPEKTVFMGSLPADPGRVLPDQVHGKRLLDAEAFIRAAAGPGVLVIDVRNSFQPARALHFGSTVVQRISMEAFLEAAGCRIWSEKKLLVIDDDGSRLLWLHWFLQAGGYIDLGFLKGGAASLSSFREETAGGQDLLREPMEAEAGLSGITVDQPRLRRLLLDPVLTADQKQFLLLILTRLAFENCSILRIDETAGAMQVQPIAMRTMADVLKTSGLVLYSASGNSLVFRVDPELAWKGTMAGSQWKENLRIFTETADPWRMEP